MGMRDAKELLKQMPKNYRELNWKVYMDVMNNVMVEKPDPMDDEDFKSYQAYSMISILLNIPITELEQLPYTTIVPLINSLAFLNQEIVLTGTKLKVKDIETLTMKEFQSIVQLLPDQWNHMDDILELVTVDLSKEEIQTLSIWEVMQVMGKLKKHSLKSLKRSKRSLAWILIKMSLKTMMKRIFRKD